VQPAALAFEPAKDIDTPTRKEFFRGWIDRRTGHQSILATSGRRMEILIMAWDGTCQKAPFTGFSTFGTKF
jgi:hypothetical protein